MGSAATVAKLRSPGLDCNWSQLAASQNNKNAAIKRFTDKNWIKLVPKNFLCSYIEYLSLKNLNSFWAPLMDSNSSLLNNVLWYEPACDALQGISGKMPHFNHLHCQLRENILWLTDTFAYLFRFSGEYYKVTIIIYWIEVLPFVGLKESITGNVQTR
jgi:hypothetical protein